MPSNDPNQSNIGPLDEKANIIARTVLRNFLSMPPLSRHDASDVLTFHSFTPCDGGLTDVKMDERWVRVKNHFPKEAVVIPLPELGDMLENFDRRVFSANGVIREMLQEILAVNYDHYSIGNVERLPTGFLKRLKPHIIAGHAVVMDPFAYKEMARAVCRRLADVNSGTQLLGFMTPDLYRHALLSDDRNALRAVPAKKFYPFNGLTATPDWSEAREIVANMLSAAKYNPQELSFLQNQARQSENFSFMAMAEQQKNAAVVKRYNKVDSSPGL